MWPFKKKPKEVIYNQAWIDKRNPCEEAVEWAKPLLGKPIIEVIQILIDEKKYDWAEWVICREITHENNVRWAIFSARSVLHIFEEKYPEDKRPREAIEAAEKWLIDKSWTTYAAWSAAYSAAVDAAYAAHAAARAAAWSAADAARAAAYAAHAAYSAARAARAADAADVRSKCDTEGLRLLKEQNEQK
jgi:hypothetical protein